MIHLIVTRDATPRVRLNIVSGTEERELLALRDRLQGESLASTRADVGGLLDSLDETFKADVLDLIGHSATPRDGTSDRYLQIGTWFVDKERFTSATFARWSPFLTRMGINTVRLLGCGTATTPGGRKCIREIKRRLGNGFRVCGTRRLLSIDDYSADGFEAEAALIEADQIGPVQLEGRVSEYSAEADQVKPLLLKGGGSEYSAETIVPVPVERISGKLPDDAIVPVPLSTHLLQPEAFESLPSVSWNRIVPDDSAARALWKVIDPTRAWSMPGLLTRPNLEVLFPARRKMVYRAEVLVGELVRVRGPWPHDGGLIYQIKDPAAFRNLLG